MLFLIQMGLVVSGGKELEILGDVHDEEEAIDEDDEMKKREDSSTTNWFKCGDTSRWRPPESTPCCRSPGSA